MGKTRKKKARVLFSCLRFLNSVDPTISEPGTSNHFHDSALQHKNPYLILQPRQQKEKWCGRIKKVLRKDDKDFFLRLVKVIHAAWSDDR